MAKPPAGVRIGELSRRVAVQPATLRAWERRYGLPRPARSRAGQRLYGADQERRVRRMLGLMGEGFAPQVAARMALDEAQRASAEAPAFGATGAPPGVVGLAEALRLALDAPDERAAHRALDRLLATCGLEVAVRDVLLPSLQDLGERWATAAVGVAQEHFASALLSGRLRALSRPSDADRGPHAILACPAGERHDLGLLCFGLVLAERGWRVATLGAETPLEAAADAAGRLDADLVVLAGPLTEPLAAAATELGQRPLDCPVAFGGRGATRQIAARAGARLLPDDVVRAADDLAAIPLRTAT